MNLLEVKDLCKSYKGFKLRDVSFSLEKGYIMGFIGRNGAGKTTTLKCMLNLVRRENGVVLIDGADTEKQEDYCKSNVGIVFGDVDYYGRKKARIIAEVAGRFYPEWNQDAYERYLKRFDIDQDKSINQLSRGMRVKFLMALALSHNAKLLILDEPTSGLDPVSRDDLLEVFQEIIEDGEHSILFSTHITSDIEKCADFITYIKDGKIISSENKDDFLSAFREVKGTEEQLSDKIMSRLIGLKKNRFGFSGLIRTMDIPECGGLVCEPADLETIMIHFEKER